MSQQLDLSLRLCGQWRYTPYTLRAFITATMSNFYSILCHRRGSRPGRGTRSGNNNTSTLRRVLHADGYTQSTCFNRWGGPKVTVPLSSSSSFPWITCWMFYFFMERVTKQISFFPLCLGVWERWPALSNFWKIPDSHSAKLKKSHLKFMTLWRGKVNKYAIKTSSQCRPTGGLGRPGWGV